ncbi:Sensor histidine kinase TodS [Rosistilla oblonga]|uniref:CHASE4 domain-containing protein n=1 Tax=Rosistilla oblonga TaxID=2527990 RepID=UPI00118D0BCC|nr:CHASE4 domain-containing protein [Rosistilla oblonga]QDV12160.1 Sensor histidine kinase TodS [Rosistilla oblonga]
MNLRLKILLTLIAVFSLYVVIDAAIQQLVIFPRFVSLEQREASQNLYRCQQAIQRDIENLDFFVHDCAAWDDLHEFTADPTRRVGAERYIDTMFRDTNLNLLAVVDTDGNVLHRSFRNVGDSEPLDSVVFPAVQWPLTHPLLQHKSTDGPPHSSSIGGLLMTEYGPIQVASRPILRTGGLPPINGTLIMGRFLDEKVVKSIADQSSVAFTVTPLSVNLTPQSSDSITPQDRDVPIAITEIDDERLAVESMLLDITGQPILRTHAMVYRNITQTGRVAMRYALGSLLVAAFVVLTILLVLLQSIVISPLTHLSDRASHIGETGDLGVRVNVRRSDEFGNLARHFNGMVDNLADTQSRLIELSRRAGMSDVATGVLHNVGNVMTNVNVLSSSMSNRLEQSKLVGLKKSVDLLRANEHQMSEFLATDPRGQKLPGYICQVTDHLELEHLEILQQLQSMSTNLQHAGQILESQQKLATGAQVIESVRPKKLISDAIGMLQASLDSHDVTVSVRCGNLPEVRMDRGKVIQVLVNLIANAKDAIKDIDARNREIEIDVTLSETEELRIEVVDHGCGITPENMEKVFSSGFTTKPLGHGHGLHYCANAARQMKGSLTVHSPGAGLGASFVLSLPKNSVPEAV